ncbi:MAG: DUF1801 domain-containing protein [Alphaproteobacteria bacterium]|nr:DUF1801 domain-containing protein [Alphaproteobacteria bacterium]
MARRAKKKADGEAEVLEKIAAMPEPFRGLGERLHALIRQSVPELKPRVWYGMPGYALDGPVLCFFRADEDYMTFGLTEKVNLTVEEGASHRLMGCAWFFTGLDDATEARLSEIVRKAVA